MPHIKSGGTSGNVRKVAVWALTAPHNLYYNLQWRAINAKKPGALYHFKIFRQPGCLLETQ